MKVPCILPCFIGDMVVTLDMLYTLYPVTISGSGTHPDSTCVINVDKIQMFL